MFCDFIDKVNSTIELIKKEMLKKQSSSSSEF